MFVNDCGFISLIKKSSPEVRTGNILGISHLDFSIQFIPEPQKVESKVGTEINIIKNFIKNTLLYAPSFYLTTKFTLGQLRKVYEVLATSVNLQIQPDYSLDVNSSIQTLRVSIGEGRTI